MDRRTFLRTGAVAAGLSATAGCSLPGGEQSLGSVETTTDDDGTEKHLTVRRDDTDQATISIMQRGRPATRTDRFGLELYVWHREGLSIDSLRFRMRAPPMSVDPPADIYLKTPSGGPWPPVDLNTVDNLWTVIDVDDIGELGDGSLGLETLVDPGSVAADEVAIFPEVTFSTSGALDGKRVVETETRFTPVLDDG